MVASHWACSGIRRADPARSWRSTTTFRGSDSPRALRRSEEQYRELADSLPGGVYTATAEGNCDYCNRWWCDYTGLAADRVLDCGWAEALHPDDRTEGLALWTEAMRTGRPFQTEHRFRRADGVYRWFLDQAVPFRDAQGRIVKWYGACMDIEDRKRAEEEALRLARHIGLLMESTGEGIYGIDREGRCTFINRAGAAMLGYEPEEVIGREMHALIHHTRGRLPLSRRGVPDPPGRPAGDGGPHRRRNRLAQGRLPLARRVLFLPHPRSGRRGRRGHFQRYNGA